MGWDDPQRWAWRHAYQKQYHERVKQLEREAGASIHGKTRKQIVDEAHKYASRSCEQAINRERHQDGVRRRKMSVAE